MKIEITDPDMGTRTLDVNDHAGLIADQLKMLKMFQKKGNNTQALRDDIEFYEFILASADVQQVALEYLNAKARFREQGLSFRFNHEVGNLLGWAWRKQ